MGCYASKQRYRGECKLTEVRIRPSVTYSGNIRNEIGVTRFPCNEIAMSDGFEKQNLAPTVPKTVHANDLSLEICIPLVCHESAKLSRLLAVLPSLCENAVNSGLA